MNLLFGPAIHLELNRLRQKIRGYQDSLGYPINLDLAHLAPLQEFLLLPFNNLGNPFEDTTCQLCNWAYEREVLSFVAKLYQFPNTEDYQGYLTSGGTEANLQGLYIARERYPQGILYFSADSHYSVPKIAHLLRMTHQKIPSLPTGEINYAILEQAISQQSHQQPVILSLNIGTTMKGAIDDVQKVLALLQRQTVTEFYIHCDAALFGMILPFLEGAPKIDFTQPIHSLAISGHKFIGSPFPCGIILTRYKLQAQHIAYVDTLDTTITGSRNGHTPLILWYTLQIKGYSGLQQEAQTCIAQANDLYDQLTQLNYPCQLNPYSNIVLLKKPPQALIKKWDLAVDEQWAHVVIMQHVTPEKKLRFINDIKKCEI